MKNSQIIVVLSEIYGNNAFIQDVCQRLESENYDTYCPNIIHHAPYSYNQMEEAYEHFMSVVGFDEYKQIIELIDALKVKYEKVYVIGFSIGATIAYRCSTHPNCDGIIACYGSRIRDYLDLTPSVHTLVLTAKEEGFDVSQIINRLFAKQNIRICPFDSSHGFLDPFSSHFNPIDAQSAWKEIHKFLHNQNCQHKNS